MTDDAWRQQHAMVEQMVRALMDCPIPIIAAVNGAAYAGGMELALGCDFVYAAQSARFALTEVTLGIMPGAAGTQNLPRAVGVRRAKELILTGTPFTAEQALAWGMVNKVCADDKLMDEVLAVARRIADNAPISVRQAKKAHRQGDRPRPQLGLRLRDRGLQPHGRYRGPPGRHQRLQREAQAEVQGANDASVVADRTDPLPLDGDGRLSAPST